MFILLFYLWVILGGIIFFLSIDTLMPKKAPREFSYRRFAAIIMSGPSAWVVSAFIFATD